MPGARLTRPPWETDEADEPPGRPLARKPATEPDYTHPLLDHHVRGGSHRVEVARLKVSSMAFRTQRGLLGDRAYPQTLEADRDGEYAVCGTGCP